MMMLATFHQSRCGRIIDSASTDSSTIPIRGYRRVPAYDQKTQPLPASAIFVSQSLYRGISLSAASHHSNLVSDHHSETPTHSAGRSLPRTGRRDPVSPRGMKSHYWVVPCNLLPKITKSKNLSRDTFAILQSSGLK